MALKRFFITALALCVFAGLAQAQPTTRKVYRDSLSGNATAAGHLANETPGYGQYKYLRTDIGAYKDKMLAIQFVKLTDSIRVSGGFIDFGQDTIWTPLCVPVAYPKTVAGINTASGSKELRDTCVTWITDVGLDLGKTRIVDLSNFHFPLYRVCLAPYDSGKVYINDIRRGGY